jgi:hypothetical protein
MRLKQQKQGATTFTTSRATTELYELRQAPHSKTTKMKQEIAESTPYM